MRTLLIAALAIAATAVSAQTYRWTDSGGRTMISDTAPPGKPKNVVKNDDKATAGDNLPFATQRAMAAFPVVLYTAPDCGDHCKQARELLTGRGIPFTEKLLQSDADFAELKQLVGDTFIPSIKVGNQRQRGFEAAAYNNLLDLAGYPAGKGAKAAGTAP